MALVEINFDGIVGPTHNYAGLSFGNLASTRNSGAISYPRAAALQGVDKMRSNLGRGLSQGILVPHPRPHRQWLGRLGTTIENADQALAANAMSASAMWAANAATVSPSPDTVDGKCHLTVANLRTMPHRSHEWPQTLAQLRLAFSNPAFVVHEPVPSTFGDEGAANHMRLAEDHGRAGVEVFVHGVAGGSFPARQHIEASRAVARLHQLNPDRLFFAEQSPDAIAAGAFHNDVVAVANGSILFAHEQAFADPEPLLDFLAAKVPGFEYVEVPADQVSLEDAIRSYLFNAQLVSTPDGETRLIVPSEVMETSAVRNWLERHLAGNGPIRKVDVVDVRQSMANGGGPACLRLRVVADPNDVDDRFLASETKLDAIAAIIERHWPEQIHRDELNKASLVRDVENARLSLLESLALLELA